MKPRRCQEPNCRCYANVSGRCAACIRREEFLRTAPLWKVRRNFVKHRNRVGRCA